MNISEWQTHIRNRLMSMLSRTKVELPDTAYGLVSAVALAPLVSAVVANDPMSAYSVGGDVLAGLSGNLLTNQFQTWVEMRNGADSEETFTAQLAIDLKEQALKNEEMRDTLDQIHEKLASLGQLPSLSSRTCLSFLMAFCHNGIILPFRAKTQMRKLFNDHSYSRNYP
ncbi:MAG: hypothetical protein AAF702_01745 [Chloroflexota bacterium]